MSPGQEKFDFGEFLKRTSSSKREFDAYVEKVSVLAGICPFCKKKKVTINLDSIYRDSKGLNSNPDKVFRKTCGDKECTDAFRLKEIFPHEIDRSGVPLLYRNARKKDFTEKQWFLAEKALSIAILGKNGVGKSHMAAAWMAHWIWYIPGIKTEWISAPKLLSDFRDSYNRDARTSEKQVIKKYTNDCDLLVLDDLGAEKITDWSLSALYIILSDRIEMCLRTCVTTNLTMEQILNYEPRIASRLMAFTRIKLEGDDQRILQGRRKNERRSP